MSDADEQTPADEERSPVTGRRLVVELLSTLDGFSGAGEDAPAFFGYYGPDFERWIQAGLDQPHVLLMGRRTYDVMSGITADDESEDAKRMMATPKVVFSNTLQEPLAWANTRVISGELGDAIRALKGEPGDELRTMGSATLVSGLLGAGLVDRLRIIVFPQVLGATGNEPIFAGAPDFDLELVETKVLDGRLVLLDYAPLRERHTPEI